MVQGNLRGVLPTGTELRGYEMKSILGQGAFGITYRARDLTLHRDVAIKEYLPTTLALRDGHTTVVPRSPEHAEQFAWGRERFLEEARTLARLDLTTAIVRVYDFLEANGTAYMIMALVEGETLAKRLQREQRLGPEAIEKLLFPLLDGLEDVHAAGFLHRDIKPANIMIDAEGNPTLIDFGASRAAMAQRTTTLTAIFTPGYAAAEQFTSAKLGPGSDIHGLAATFYHAIAGRVPPSAIERIMNDTCEPLSQIQPAGFSPALLAGIDAGLAVRVEDRPQTIAEWRSLLRGDESGVSSGEATRVVRRPGRLARMAGRSLTGRKAVGHRALWGAAAGATLLLVGGGYLAFDTDEPATAATTAARNLTARQLERALAERRRADALVAEMRELEEEARQKAEAEAQSTRQAEATLERARVARQKAEDDLAQLRADIGARRQAETAARQQAEAAARQQVELAARQQVETGEREQAEAALRRTAEEAAERQTAEAAQRQAEEAAQRQAEVAAASLRQAEEEAKRKAIAEAEAKRQADEVLAKVEAERQRAEQEARRKSEAEAAAMRQASEEAQRTAAAEADKATAAAAKAKEEAEAAERGLRLDQPERERLQVALTSLGFDTRGSDGVFGPRSREMVAAWQKARNQPTTGFLNSAQRQMLLKEAAAALSKHDEQKKGVDAPVAAIAPPEARPPEAVRPPAVATVTPAPATSSTGTFDGAYTGVTPNFNRAGIPGAASVNLQVANRNGSGAISSKTCGSNPFTVSISPAGDVSGNGQMLTYPVCDPIPVTITGRAEGVRFYLSFSTSLGIARVTVSRGGN